MRKTKLATVWLDGCSGCHMSLLDIDEALIPLAGKIDMVYGPLVDAQEFPKGVDVTVVEGAVSSQDDLEKIRLVRSRSKLVVALGDCAVTSNIPGMRNPFGVKAVLERAFVDTVTIQKPAPTSVIPALLDRVRPIHEVVPVDVFVPGCPPSADLIYLILSDLIAGRTPSPGLEGRFGA